jgi:F-type H+-transporting ATPase subunit alpha
VLTQPQLSPLRLADEVALIVALQAGVLDRVPLEKIAQFRSELPVWLDRSASALVDQIERCGQLDDAGRSQLRESLAALAERLAAEPNSLQLRIP